MKNLLNYKKPAFWVSVVAIVAVVAVSLSLAVRKQTEKKPVLQPEQSIPISVSGASETEYKTAYTKVTIEFLSRNKGFKSADTIEVTDYNTVARIDNAIRYSMKHSDETDLENNHTNQYNLKFSNNVGGYSCGLYYDTLYDKAYLVNNGGLLEAGIDLARYIDSFFENTNISFNIDKADAALFKTYGWTLDYQINEMKIKLGDIGILSDFNPNSYYFAYNNELSKDIGLDMSGYSNTSDIDVYIYRINESMPKEFFPIKSTRGIVVKNGDQTIGAFLSAGRHSAFSSCSLKGNNFEKATGQTLNKWLEGRLKADITEERLSKLAPKQVVEEYFNALDKKDAKAAEYCMSKRVMLGNLTSNMLNEELFNTWASLPLSGADIGGKSVFGYLKSAKLLKVEPLKRPDNSGGFRVTVNLQYNDGAIIANSSGQQSWDCSMIYESPQTGWKIAGFGHG